ncbi:MAG: glyoxalase [Polaribacter sp.]
MTKKERPILSNLVQEGTTEIEKFQNEVLRPIIKMQHNFLISFFKNNTEKRKIIFDELPNDKKKKVIRTSLTKDINFKNILLGSIIGHFSLDELEFYQQNTSEINRRILQIVKQRLQDSISEI